MFWQMSINSRFRKYVAFQFGKKAYQFTVIPFGFTTAPNLFTRFIGFYTNIMVKEGINILTYLDD